jgi:hypothetical protein
VTHFEINAQDAPKTQKFYRDLFGWGIDTNNPQSYGMIDTKAKGNGINGGIGATQTGRSWVTFYVETDDLAKTLAKAEQLGGRTVMQPMDAGMVMYALFEDPEGNVIGLAKNTDQPQAQPAASSERRTTRARANGNNGARAKSTAKRTTARARTTTKKSTGRSRSKRSRS